MAAKSDDHTVGNYACIVNCIEKEGLHILSTLLEELTAQKVPAQQLESTPQQSIKWLVDNKYYSAELELFVCPSAQEDAWSSGGLLGREREYQAVVLLCDIDKPEALDSLKSLWTRVKVQSTQEGGSPNGGEFPLPEVCAVVGVSVSDSSNSDILQWCVGEGLELIEWVVGENPCAQSQDTDSDDGLPPEVVGVTRLAETLQAHMWPNITMKGRDPTTSVYQEKDGTRETLNIEQQGSDKELVTTNSPTSASSLERLESKVVASSSESKNESRERIDGLLPTEDQLSSALSEDPGGEEFEDLFSRFAQMKHHAETLPHEDRKAYAEKVVMAFWNAIGGDEDEVTKKD